MHYKHGRIQVGILDSVRGQKNSIDKRDVWRLTKDWQRESVRRIHETRRVANLIKAPANLATGPCFFQVSTTLSGF